MGDEYVAAPEKIKGWKYLERIAGKIAQEKDISIGILNGGNTQQR